MKRQIPVVVATLALFCGLCIVESATDSARQPERTSGRASSAAMLAGEFRTVFANLLWIKADKYHHEFIEHNPNWTQNKELMGMLKLITALDPHFEGAYASGTVIYSKGYRDKKKALNYLLEGIANNPRSWDLHRMAVVMYARDLRDPATALYHARLAEKYCDDEAYKPSVHALVRTVERIIAEQKRGPGRSKR